MSHVFISYVSENQKEVDLLYEELTKHGVKVWLDRNDIKPGMRWKDAIREAIQDGSFFIACFSDKYYRRDTTYMNEELMLAIEQLSLRPTNRIWFIPVLLSECDVPARNIGGRETLLDIQWVPLYQDWDAGVRRILDVIDPTPSKVQKLITALDSGVEEIREDVIRVLGETGHAGSVPVLMELLGNENVTVRGQAAIALGNVGDASTVTALTDLLQDKYDYVRECAAVALGNAGDARAVPSLIEALDDMNMEVLVD